MYVTPRTFTRRWIHCSFCLYGWCNCIYWWCWETGLEK